MLRTEVHGSRQHRSRTTFSSQRFLLCPTDTCRHSSDPEPHGAASRPARGDRAVRAVDLMRVSARRRSDNNLAASSSSVSCPRSGRVQGPSGDHAGLNQVQGLRDAPLEDPRHLPCCWRSAFPSWRFWIARALVRRGEPNWDVRGGLGPLPVQVWTRCAGRSSSSLVSAIDQLYSSGRGTPRWRAGSAGRPVAVLGWVRRSASLRAQLWLLQRHVRQHRGRHHLADLDVPDRVLCPAGGPDQRRIEGRPDGLTANAK